MTTYVVRGSRKLARRWRVRRSGLRVLRISAVTSRRHIPSVPSTVRACRRVRVTARVFLSTFPLARSMTLRVSQFAVPPGGCLLILDWRWPIYWSSILQLRSILTCDCRLIQVRVRAQSLYRELAEVSVPLIFTLSADILGLHELTSTRALRTRGTSGHEIRRFARRKWFPLFIWSSASPVPLSLIWLSGSPFSGPFRDLLLHISHFRFYRGSCAGRLGGLLEGRWRLSRPLHDSFLIPHILLGRSWNIFLWIIFLQVLSIIILYISYYLLVLFVISLFSLSLFSLLFVFHLLLFSLCYRGFGPIVLGVFSASN